MIRWVLVLHIVFADGTVDDPIIDTLVTYESCLTSKKIHEDAWEWSGDKEFAQLVTYECQPVVRGLKHD